MTTEVIIIIPVTTTEVIIIIPVTTTEVVSILIKLLLITIPVMATEDANKNKIPVSITEKNTVTMIPSFQMMNMQE